MDLSARNSKKRNVKPAQIIHILEKNGVKCSEKEAEEILDFLYLLAKLAVNQYFNEKEV